MLQLNYHKKFYETVFKEVTHDELLENKENRIYGVVFSWSTDDGDPCYLVEYRPKGISHDYLIRLN